MAERKRPSIFDIFDDLWRDFPFEKGGRTSFDVFRVPFEEMIKRFEEGVPKGFEDLVTEEETPRGTVRRYGPFVYGFSYTAEPGKEPVFREFGNIKPTYRGLIPSEGREPMVDLMEEEDKYKIFAELPGVDKEKIKLDVAADSLEISTEDKKFYKMVELGHAVDTVSAKASYKNGVLTVELDKAEKRKGKPISIE